MKYTTLIYLLTTGFFANAQKVNPALEKSAAFYNKNIAAIKPVYKNYIAQTAKTLRNRKLNIDSLKSTMKAPGNSMFSDVSELDISTLVQLTLQAMAQENAADVKSIMAKIDEINKKKEELRKEEERIRAVAKATDYAGINNKLSEMEKSRQQKDALNKDGQLKATQRKAADSNTIKVPAYTYTDGVKRLAEIKKEKDSLSEMGEKDTLQLQQFMEKKNQLETMISNTMKAAGDGESVISGNLKGS